MSAAKKLLFTVQRPELEVSYYASGGPGGMKKNATRNACRIMHRPSGAMVTAQERREKRANTKAALERLVAHPKFRVWWNRKVHDILSGETQEERVEKAMRPENIRTEVRRDDKWFELKGDELCLEE